MARGSDAKPIAAIVRLSLLIFIPLLLLMTGLCVLVRLAPAPGPAHFWYDWRWIYGAAVALLMPAAAVLARILGAGRRAECALNECEQRYARFFNETPVACHEVDREGRIVRVNRTELELLGYSAEQMLGHYAWEFFREKDEAQRPVAARLKGAREDVVRFERTRIRKDGSTFISASESRPLRGVTGQVIGFRTWFQDISAQKKLQAELVNSRRAQAVTVLAGGIAHDFNNLLGIVGGYLSLAQLDIDRREDALELMRKAEQGIRDAKQLTQKMLELTGGAGTERVSMALERELEGWVTDAVEISGVQVTYNFLEQLHPVSVDREQMRQAIQNVIRHALEAMPGGGVVQVEAANLSFTRAEDFPELDLTPGDYVLLTIRHQGERIREDLLEHVFDPYFSPTKRHGRNGLGLTVTAAVVHKHGGRITVESRVGAGTKFHIYLPAAQH